MSAASSDPPPHQPVADGAASESTASVDSTSVAPTSASAVPSTLNLIPNVGNSFASKASFITRTRQRAIHRLAVQYKSTNENRDLSRVPELEQFLLYLDNCIEMTPQLRDATYIDKGLDLIIDPKYRFPAHFVDTARRLKRKWIDENWGKDAVVDDAGGGGENNDDEDEAGAGVGEGAHSAPVLTDDNRVIRPPPRNHPIFGEQGIMHGVVITRGTKNGSRAYRRNPNYRPRNALVFGENSLTVGAWWPMQIVALFNGAHGSSQGGIAGSARLGATSIVVSGTYDDRDDDRGDVIYYSGSRGNRGGLHAHHHPATARATSGGATQALHTSATRGNPIRVLRSASGKSHWAPSVGIRYDGLYRIAQVRRVKDADGEPFERFELHRLPGQTPLEEVVRKSPTAQQRRDFKLIQEGY
ncbi:sra-ydg [Niveomyces insectorum RCEF 264]|uniref:Sra-ydg n=1 Tax=Niveomyces insectorum RCEF 264 TaxID=1081102 RepID=A0A167N809_9HYPO|nr:sra-ydg [Niveomyces insectorum RCEF 264]